MNLLNGLVRIFPLSRPGNRTARGRQEAARRSCQPALEALEDRWLPSSVNGTSVITGNFNGTPIQAGNTLWFTSAFKVNGLHSSPVTLHFTDDTISFTANGTTYRWNAPDAQVTFSPTAKTAATTFDAATNTWETTLPLQFSGNGFLSALAVPLTGPLPGGIQNVTWQGQFSSDTAGLSVNWQWAAAVYTSFSANYNALNVKPVDDNHVSAYQNSDHAGTPEAFLPDVIGGATGGGGSNFTGSLSATAQVTPTTLASLSGFVTTPTGAGLSGVVVALTTTNGQGQTVTVYATTDSSGFYQFTALQAGTYTLSVTPPTGYQNGTDQVGTVNGASSGSLLGSGTIGNLNLTPGSIGLNYDFQEQTFFGGSGP
jgi:hypothetical protein